MNGQGIQRIAELMGHTCGKQSQSRDAFAFDLLFRQFAGKRDVSNKHGETHVFLLINGRHIEVEVAIFRIENFQVPTHGPTSFHQFIPIKASQTFSELLPDNFFLLQPEQNTGGSINISNIPLRIEENDAFLQGFEDLLKEAFFLNEPMKIPLDIRWFHAVHAFEDLVEEAGFH